ncbi:hypothetical protein ASG01_04845 [Chryseobacterium sp. Leaf180]|nr:hypothetical protein ASG01_04845 [Chryseobacterium sp. Leaf180]
MNCKQFNTIPLEEVLLSLGHLPAKRSEKEAWFLNPFAKENHASFKVNKNLNYWYLHSAGIGGNNIDFMRRYLNASVSEVLTWAENRKFSSLQYQNTSNPKLENLSKNYEILETLNVQHPALLEYLKERKVENQTKFLVEIHYRINNKNYFGIAFKNDSDGYEIRNKYSKICLGKKDISTISNNSNLVRIFEGFFDFISFKNLENQSQKEPSDYIILNSISMISSLKKSLGSYENIELYLDNDEAGNRAVKMVMSENQNAKDLRDLYKDYKDLNDWLTNEDADLKMGYRLKR